MKKFSAEECFIVTEKDYVNMMNDVNQFRIPKENKIILRILGIIAVCCGTAAFINLRESIYQTICWIILIIIGFYVLSYYDVINPVQIKKQASKFYRYHSKMIKNAVTFQMNDELIHILSETHQLHLPKKYIHQIAECNHTILIFIDKNEFSFIPKRVVNDDDIRHLKNFADDKYIVI